jgi:hypothetical protein
MRRQTCIANRVLSVNRLVAICAAVLVAGAQSAWGSPILSWSFDETEFSIRHGDRRPIVVNATLRSDPLSDAVLITGVGASETGDLQKSFHFQFGALIPRPLAVLPGTHIHFVWGSLTPLGTPAPGQYRSDPGAFLGLQLAGVGYELFVVDSPFTVTVAEPPVAALIGIGVTAAISMGLVGWRRRRPSAPQQKSR